MKYKAIFFDMDGTLTNLETQLMPQSARDALRMARENGVKVFLATGRHPSLFQKSDVIGKVPFDAYLTVNGQFCYNAKEVIHRKEIVREDKEGLMELLKTETFPLMFIGEKETFVNMVDERVYVVTNLLQTPVSPIKDASACLSQQIFALMFYGDEAAQKRLEPVMPHCKTMRWHPAFIDIVPADGGKDSGIDAILEYYGIDLSETMAFGDAQNDMDMLRHVGMGVAMGNATDAAKEAADYVTDSVDDHGIYNAMKKFGVI